MSFPLRRIRGGVSLRNTIQSSSEVSDKRESPIGHEKKWNSGFKSFAQLPTTLGVNATRSSVGGSTSPECLLGVLG